MPALSDHKDSDNLKMLVIGDSGAGKTGSLASLANAGYKLRIIDLDNGIRPLKMFVRPGVDVLVETVTEQYKISGGKQKLLRGATAFERVLDLLNDFPGAGKPETWDQDTILVIDSLTLLSRYALERVLDLNGRFGQNPSQPNWGEAQALIENLLAMLYSTAIACNVIVISHISYIAQGGEEDLRAYPSSLGKSLSPKIPRFFDIMVLARAIGTGSNRRRQFICQSLPNMDLKVPADLKELPLETGLADIFQAVRKRPHPGLKEK